MCCSLIVNCFKLLIKFKVKKYRLITLFTFLQHILCARSQNCPLQISRVSSNVFQTVYWHSKSIPNEIVISNPPCIDQEENLVIRTCRNGLWIPEDPPVCEQLIQNNTNCPMFFKEISNSCVYISDRQSWGTRCSLTKILNENVTKKQYPLRLKGDFVWLPFKRKVKYGPYEWVTMGERYGKPIADYDYYLSYTAAEVGDDVFNKNCIVSNIRNDNMRPEYCDNSHIHVCPFYDYELNICQANCVSAGIGTTNCYCKIQNEFCETPTQINTPFDKNLLVALANEDECYVGATNTHFELQGYRQAVNKTSWFYTKKSLNCSMCTVKSIDQFPKVEMILTFERKHKKLHLQIYSPEGLYKEGNDEYIYCFTDASKELKKRVDIDKKYEYIMRNNKERNFYVYEVELEDYIGYYWCESHRKSLSDELVHSNKVLAYKEKEGNEYSLRIVVNNHCQFFNCQYSETIPYKELADDIKDSIFGNLDAEVRIMEMFSFDYRKLDVLIHLSSDEETYIMNEYYKIKNDLVNISGNIQIVYFKSSEFCMPEVTKIENKHLSWPLAYIDNSVVPEELCLENNLPVFRVCGGNFSYGAEWSTVNGKCQNETYVHESTQYLRLAFKQNLSQPLIKNVTQVVEKYTNLSVLAIYYLENFFESIYQSTLDPLDIINSTIDLIDSLLKVNATNLAEAQNFLNSTDAILDVIEDILINLKVDSQVHLIQRQRIVVHITNPYLTNVSGIIVYSSNNEIRIENFERNNTFDNVLKNPNVLLATYVPEVILQDIYDQNLTDINIVTTIFFNDYLFVSNSRKPAGPILSITIPGYGNYLPSSLPILFKTHMNQSSPECGFWDYGKNTERKKGQWSTIGGNYLGNANNESTVHSCSFSHLTHFALLILDENVSLQFINNTDDYFLTAITFVGGALTVVGITGIFLTAVFFEKWRKKQGTKILINLSIAFLLEVLTMYLTEMKGLIHSELSCQIVGSMIHYIVLSKFFWMLVYAFLQYMRFVKVLRALPENIVLKSAVFGWGFAIMPVVIVNVITPYTYSLGDHHFCYPKGLSLYLGVVMPVVLIIFVNLIVFGIVMYQVSATRIESHCGSSESYTLQLKLATLLFFVLGIPWIFGVLANLITIIWLRTMFVYLFCATSTVQGFILFLFYVIFNRETRTYWTNYFFNRETFVIVTSSKSLK